MYDFKTVVVNRNCAHQLVNVFVGLVSLALIMLMNVV